MKRKIQSINRKIEKLKSEHAEMYYTGSLKYGGNMNAVRFQCSMINERIMFLERELRDLEESM
jgi:hypothetical protein